MLIANRGEIAVRVIRAVSDLGMQAVAVYAEDDERSVHVGMAHEAVALKGKGSAAYLDIEAIVSAAKQTGADAIHPGYGFLSEREDFAMACATAGLVFIGPTPEQLKRFGDKAQAIDLANTVGVPTLPSTPGDASLEQVIKFFDLHGSGGIVIKALGGGGGRGMRVVTRPEEIEPAYLRCKSEALSAFGLAAVYAERLLVRARHIEVQIVGDGNTVVALGERDCTLQRRFQKLIEIAPSPKLLSRLRAGMIQASLAMAQRLNYLSLATFEFLVEEDASGNQSDFFFIETNPRLQVEHTVTEQVTGVDLVATQLEIARGKTLEQLGFHRAQPTVATGFSIQVRINHESTDDRGLSHPAQGQLLVFQPPCGMGIRLDTHGYAGYTPSPYYDTLLAKLIVTSASADFTDAVRRLRRALTEFQIDGLQTNLSLLSALVESDDFVNQQIHTRYWDEHLGHLLAQKGVIEEQQNGKLLSRLKHEAANGPLSPMNKQEMLEDQSLVAVRAVTHGSLAELTVTKGATVVAGQTLAVIESMKMQHLVVTESAGIVVDLRAHIGELVQRGQILIALEAMTDLQTAMSSTSASPDPNQIRPDLQKVIDRQAYLLDENRPDAVARRRSRGQRTARENVADLCDPDTFVEYGGLAVAAQATRRAKQDLIANTPADGLITGVGDINGALVSKAHRTSAVMAYDATVLAGTQGKRNHVKTDRLVEVAMRNKFPFVLFAEGGGGRPGEVDIPSISGLHQPSFASFAELSGEVPVVGIVSGRCFAGNAAFLGCCDVIIADRSANIGMAGPAMIEGGGLGIFRPEEVGPASVQFANGVIDVLVDNEVQAVAAAKHYLSMFQGSIEQWQAPDARVLRSVVPENRLHAYDTRRAIEGIADVGSVLELRAGFGTGIHTALARIEGKPVGIVANNPKVLGGAIDADAGDKAARFMQLCNAHGLPIVSLIDTPGFMVGPEVEAKAQVRHVSRMFLIGAKLRVPLLAVTLRKAYGLGAMAMAGGGFRSADCKISWPTGEFGPMGLEGAVRLGFKKELDAVADSAARKALYDKLVAQMYERGHALNVAAHVEIDAVIDPAETRRWLVKGIAASVLRSHVQTRSFVDAW